jgi:hypothetical protein
MDEPSKGKCRRERQDMERSDTLNTVGEQRQLETLSFHKKRDRTENEFR